MSVECAVESAPHGPDVDFVVDHRAGFNIKQLGRTVRHGGVFGGRILHGESKRAGGDGCGRGGEGTEIHQDRGETVVVDHDVAFTGRVSVSIHQ